MIKFHVGKFKCNPRFAIHVYPNSKNLLPFLGFALKLRDILKKWHEEASFYKQGFPYTLPES
jgi:hypothetical protein